MSETHEAPDETSNETPEKKPKPEGLLAWKLGCREPDDRSRKLLADQMHLAHEFHNALVAAELGRRHAVRAVLCELATGKLAELLAEETILSQKHEDAWAVVKAGRKGKHPEDRASEDAQKLAREVAKGFGKLLENLRKKITPLRQDLAQQLRCPGHLVLDEKLRVATEKVQAQLNHAHTDAERKKIQSEGDAERKRIRAAERIEFDPGCLRCIDDRGYVFAKSLYNAINERGLYWGTSLQVGEAVDFARRGVMDPRFRRWGEQPDYVAVQLQGGLAAEDVGNESGTLVQITSTPWAGDRRREAEPGSKLARSRARHALAKSRGIGVDKVTDADVATAITTGIMPEARTLSGRAVIVKLRVGTARATSKTQRSKKPSSGRPVPVWAEIPAIIHRPLPPGSRIKWARLIRERVGTRDRWDLVFSIKMPKNTGSADSVEQSGTLVINPGWRAFKVPGRKKGEVGTSLRVASWISRKPGQPDVIGELRLPTAIDELHAVDGLRGVRDKRMELLCATMSLRVKELVEAGTELPNWLSEAARWWSGWRRPERWLRCLQRWVDEKLPEHESIATIRAEFWKKERHLHDWEDNQRRQVQDQRLDVYRKFSVWGARTHERIIVGEMDLRTFATKDLDEEWHRRVERYQQRAACIHQLRNELEHAARKYGAVWDLRESKHATVDCAGVSDHPGEPGQAAPGICTSREEWDAGMELVHTCKVCSRTWDQDWNHCRNLLARSEQPGDEAAQVRRSRLKTRRNRKKILEATEPTEAQSAAEMTAARETDEDKKDC